MKIFSVLCGVALAVTCGVVLAQGSNPNLNANILRKRLDDFTHYQDRKLSQEDEYAALDAASYLDGVSDEALLAKRACPSKALSGMQTVLIVLNYMNAHPNEWDQPSVF